MGRTVGTCLELHPALRYSLQEVRFGRHGRGRVLVPLLVGMEMVGDGQLQAYNRKRRPCSLGDCVVPSSALLVQPGERFQVHDAVCALINATKDSPI